MFNFLRSQQALAEVVRLFAGGDAVLMEGDNSSFAFYLVAADARGHWFLAEDFFSDSGVSYKRR